MLYSFNLWTNLWIIDYDGICGIIGTPNTMLYIHKFCLIISTVFWDRYCYITPILKMKKLLRFTVLPTQKFSSTAFFRIRRGCVQEHTGLQGAGPNNSYSIWTKWNEQNGYQPPGEIVCDKRCSDYFKRARSKLFLLKTQEMFWWCQKFSVF